MRRPAFLLALALLTAVPAAAAGVLPDRILPDADLLAALDVYVDDSIFTHQIEIACFPDQRAVVDAAWDSGNRVLVASLWANGLPADAVRAIASRLAGAEPAADPIDCASDEVNYVIQRGADAAWWTGQHAQTLKEVGLRTVEHPPTDAQWQDVKALFGTELPLQARAFACLAIFEPTLFPSIAHEWTGTVVAAGRAMVAAGLPRDEVVTLIDGAGLTALWHRAEPGAVADLKRSCADDKAWYERYSVFDMQGLSARVAKILDAP